MARGVLLRFCLTCLLCNAASAVVDLGARTADGNQDHSQRHLLRAEVRSSALSDAAEDHEDFGGHTVNKHSLLDRPMEDNSSEPKKPKYLRESKLSPHLDAEYGTRKLSQGETRESLHHLLEVMAARVAAPRHLRPVLNSGTLIGMTQGEHILPWDDDADLWFTEEDFGKLAAEPFEDDEAVLRVNPDWKDRQQDPQNTIQARLVSKKTGAFIDIIWFWSDADGSLRSKGFIGQGVCRFSRKAMCPLQQVTFDDVQGYYIPHDTQLFFEEYPYLKHQPSTHFHGYVFDDKTKKWTRAANEIRVESESPPTHIVVLQATTEC